MRKILILHHVEPMWEDGFDKDVFDYMMDIIRHIEQQNYDKVILTTMEGGSCYPEIKHLVDVEEQWGYGWEDPEDCPEIYKNWGIDIKDIIQANGHEFAYLYSWIKELKGNDIHLAGGHQFECLQDLVDSLEHLNISYTKQHELIYG
jgi:hypothetical protein